MDAKNICIFCGKIISFRTMEIGNGYLWGYGDLFLPDSSNSTSGQTIRIQAWEERASLLASLKPGSFVKVLSTFHINNYKGKEQPVFVVYELHTHNSQD